ncbi:ABC transporter substrate-binding protein [Desulfopila aestuarii]|uniref:Amino acid/amide ABC transporter substrate-binding protein, HAAT family n=1 Tax=Desulfopila aestuarii DSM 18488 TaxID=1121416 RepID=A0A1M7Y5Q6_9BACT|nr:ABC transporter substrate-binding protein [Desulfopila aestuarii]SHO47805.1 amino acid/amide ABC transporter substrate-binding protein, HAAT family [Desulfopila aestuarii DSM 18488]
MMNAISACGSEKKDTSWLVKVILFYSMSLLLALVLTFQMGPAVAETNPVDSTQQPVSIAVIFSLTGIAARHNQPVVEMVIAAVGRVNESGGVLGRPIKLLILDNKSTSIGALEAAHEAVAAKVDAVIGAHWSSHSLAMAPVLQKAGIPMITPTSTNPEVTFGRDYVFRVCFGDDMQGKAMAKFARDELKIKTVSILANVDEHYSVDLAAYFRTEFLHLGGGVVLDAVYRGDSADFSEIIDELLKYRPDAVYIPGYTRDTALFMKQARKKGVKALFLGGDGWDLIGTLIDDEIEGSYQTVLWHPDMPYPEAQVIREMYREMSDNPLWNLTAPLGYDAIMVLVDAINRAGSFDRKKIRDALAKTHDFRGAAGPIAMDENGNPQNKEITIVKFVGGESQYITAVQP